MTDLLSCFTLEGGVRMILDWSECAAVETVPERPGGAWVFKNTRLPISTVFQNLEASATVQEIAEWFDISPQLIKEVLDFAARSLEGTPHPEERKSSYEDSPPE